MDDSSDDLPNSFSTHHASLLVHLPELGPDEWTETWKVRKADQLGARPLSRGERKLCSMRREYSPRLAPQEDLDGEWEVVVAPAGAVVLRLVPRANHVALLARQF